MIAQPDFPRVGHHGKFISGKVGRVVVRARRVEPPAPDDTKEWIENVWREKDALLDGIV